MDIILVYDPSPIDNKYLPGFLNWISVIDCNEDEFPPPRFTEREVNQNLELEKAKPSTGVARTPAGCSLGNGQHYWGKPNCPAVPREDP